MHGCINGCSPPIKLAQAELYLQSHLDKLVILDEVHRVPGLFPLLRGLIDQARRAGRAEGRYLLLGSASLDVLKQSGETLAGRIAYLELSALNVLEVGDSQQDRLWLRGGFPASFQAPTDARSMRWREDFIRTYLERDIPQFGPRIAAETLRRFWTMLAHHQGGLLNAAQLARNLGVDVKKAGGYIDLLGIETTEHLLSHMVVGASWEGNCIENLFSCAPQGVTPYFYRTSGGGRD